MNQHSWRRDFLWLFLAIGIFFCIGLGVRPYLTPSEARYIEVPRQMLITNDWLTPRLNGVPYFEKPPLFYWLQASVMQFFGTGEFAGRITTLLLDTLLCLVTYATGRLLYGRLSGLLAAAVITTCALGYTLGRVAMLDTPVTLFLTLTFACFLAAQHASTEGKPEQKCFYWGMYIAAAAAVMTKGLIGIVIPGLVIGAWIAITGRWRILKEVRLFSGLVLFLILTAPWHVLMAEKHPAFFQFYFIHEHFQRFLTDEAKRVQPWWFFIAITIAGLLPWIGLMPSAAAEVGGRTSDIRKFFLNLRHPTSNLYLFLWIILPLIFFSASHSKLAPYIFPIFPPLCILLGRYLAECWEGRITTRALRINSLVVAAIFTTIILVYYFVPLPISPEDKLDFATGLNFFMLLPIILALVGLVYGAVTKRADSVLIIALALFTTAVISTNTIVAAGVLALVWLVYVTASIWLVYVVGKRRFESLLIINLALFAGVFDISANTIAAAIDRANVKPLVAILKQKLHDGDTVAAYGAYFQDLPIYLNRNVVVGGYTGELDFGVTHYPETHSWMLDQDQFWQLCAKDQRPFYVFMKNTTYNGIVIPVNCRLHVLAKYGKTVLLEKGIK